MRRPAVHARGRAAPGWLRTTASEGTAAQAQLLTCVAAYIASSPHALSPRSGDVHETLARRERRSDVLLELRPARRGDGTPSVPRHASPQAIRVPPWFPASAIAAASTEVPSARSDGHCAPLQISTTCTSSHHPLWRRSPTSLSPKTRSGRQRGGVPIHLTRPEQVVAGGTRRSFYP
jgi:hypothetical protein